MSFDFALKDFYRKRIFVRDNGEMNRCTFIEVKRPDKNVAKEYEKLKSEFTGDLFGELSARIKSYKKRQDMNGLPTSYTQQRILEELQKPGGTNGQILRKKKIIPGSITQYLTSLRKRGYNVVRKGIYQNTRFFIRDSQ